MSEKLEKTNQQTTESSWDSLNPENESREPRFPGDPRQYTEAELLADPAKRFRVNPEDFPIFASQGEKEFADGPSLEQPLNYTLGRFVRDTADTIAAITGEIEEGEQPPYDHVIYLDK